MKEVRIIAEDQPLRKKWKRNLWKGEKKRIHKTQIYSDIWDIGPCTLCFPLVNDLLDVSMIKIRAQKFIANDLLDFGVIKANNMFLQGVLVHVCGNRSVGNRRDRF
jgi:hypothetical protein